MSSLNKVMLIGRLGTHPEMRYTQSQTPICNFSLATSETWKDKNGEKKESTEWHSIVVWGKQGENCATYLSKGSLVYIEGKIKTQTYMKNDEKRYSTNITADRVQFLESGKKEKVSSANLPQNTPDEPKKDDMDDIPF